MGEVKVIHLLSEYFWIMEGQKVIRLLNQWSSGWALLACTNSEIFELTFIHTSLLGWFRWFRHLNQWSSGRTPLEVILFAAVKTFDANIDIIANFVLMWKTRGTWWVHVNFIWTLNFTFLPIPTLFRYYFNEILHIFWHCSKVCVNFVSASKFVSTPTQK